MTKKFFNKVYQSVKTYLFLATSNPFYQIPFVIILFIPLMATLGQYIATRFILESTHVELLFWPGVNGEVAANMPVWLAMGAMIVSYFVGIAYLAGKRNLGKVILLGIIASILTTALGSIMNSFTGWEEHQLVADAIGTGQVNIGIFSLWHNPAWEEIVFRGIPLLILFAILKNTGKKVSFWAKLGYMVIPSIAFSIYHIPNHGLARILDTFVLGLIWSWMALRFSFFAPLIVHYLADNIIIPNLGNILNVPKEEISWLLNNGHTLNSIFTGGLLLIIILIPILVVWYVLKRRQQRLRTISIEL